MSRLRDTEWGYQYTPDSCDIIQEFYVPVLRRAQLYQRTAGYFSAKALALAARGIEGLIKKDGRMQLIVGCTLEKREVEAIQRGEELRACLERRAIRLPLNPGDNSMHGALELLSWMVANRYLEVKVAVPCDSRRQPVPGDLYHEKTGIIADSYGDIIGWTGSLNETAAGWGHNWERISVSISWEGCRERKRVREFQADFERQWADRTSHLLVMDMPEVMRRDLMRFEPKSHLPDRIDPKKTLRLDPQVIANWRAKVWAFIGRAPRMPAGGKHMGEETCPITPWPHQSLAFGRMYDHWPPRLLIADEVGLGKTIQAGLLLRQAWLSRRARRILILAPKALLRQWQIELREKFNLSWPIYDGSHLVWYDPRGEQAGTRKAVSRNSWHQEPAVLASSQLVRRKDRAEEVCNNATPWDLIVLDEAHHARRRSAGSKQEGPPNLLLALMQKLKERCEGLVLLTATPMQIAPIEVWDLLNLLGMPLEWSEESFLKFFRSANSDDPSPELLIGLAPLFRAVEREFGKMQDANAHGNHKVSRIRVSRVQRALRDTATIPTKRLNAKERQVALQVMCANTPVRRLISRHTRKLLRSYHKEGRIDSPIADRQVEDNFLELSKGESQLYSMVEQYIRRVYKRATGKHRSVVGLVMVIYRRRLASSLRALRETLAKRQASLEAGKYHVVGDDLSHVESVTEDDPDGPDELVAMEHDPLRFEEVSTIRDLLHHVDSLPPDTKARALCATITALRQEDYEQVMVFTQYTDTMDFLRDELTTSLTLRIMCFSGRGGEVPDFGGSWHTIKRDEAKEKFRRYEADVLLCTEAAAEGLNFQFCGALINYDMPWNPMKVEQRIGRIDRVGQKHQTVRIVNLLYKGTIESDVYIALRSRIKLFEDIVGHLQPILSRVARTIDKRVLEGGKPDGFDAEVFAEEAEDLLDLESMTAAPLSVPERLPSPVTMDDLDHILRMPELLPMGYEVRRLGPREYDLKYPDAEQRVRITTNPQHYEQHSDNVQLWSPGNLAFDNAVRATERPNADPTFTSLSDLLEAYRSEVFSTPAAGVTPIANGLIASTL